MPPEEGMTVRALMETDLAEADRIFRLAFGTFLGLPDPLSFAGDADMTRSRWLADPSANFGAFLDGRLAGSNFVTGWGSVGFFGPLTVHPDFWNQGIAQRLLEPTVDWFERQHVRHAGLFTFAQSTKHLHLYQRFGFWPRFITSSLIKPVTASPAPAMWTCNSALPGAEQTSAVNACAELTGSLYDGLDVQREIRAVQAQHIGDTLLLEQGGRLVAFAVCHWGRGSEAGDGMCYCKFAAVRPGPDALQIFGRLLEACESLAAAHSLQQLEVGVNTARHRAYRELLARGFRAVLQGVTMHRPNEPGYDHEDVYILDDWH